MPAPQPIKVLFLCIDGEIRSRAAADMFKNVLKERGQENLFHVEFGGVGNVMEHPKIAKTIEERGIVMMAYGLNPEERERVIQLTHGYALEAPRPEIKITRNKFGGMAPPKQEYSGEAIYNEIIKRIAVKGTKAQRMANARFKTRPMKKIIKKPRRPRGPGR